MLFHSSKLLSIKAECFFCRLEDFSEYKIFFHVSHILGLAKADKENIIEGPDVFEFGIASEVIYHN